jgi:type I restriction enzyme, S subunit
MPEDRADPPPGWELKTLGQVATVVGGGTPAASDQSNFSSSSGHPWITPADLSDYTGKYVYHGRRYLTDKGLSTSSAKYLPEGAVLFSSRAPIGYVAIAGNRLATNQGFRSFVPSPEVTSDFLYYTLKAIVPIAEQLASGTTFAELSGSAAARLPIALPSLAEQQLITEWLDRVFARALQLQSTLNRADSTLGRAVEATREAAIVAAINGPTTPQSISGDDQGKQPKLLIPSDIDPSLPDLPAMRVPMTSLGDLAEDVRYGISIQSDTVHFAGSIPMIRMGNIQDGHLVLDDLKFVADNSSMSKFVLRDGDLLFNRTNSPELVGKTAVFHDTEEMVFASYIIRVRLNRQLAEPEFVSLWINSAWGRRWAQSVKTDGISQSNINSQKLKAFPVPLPTLDIQRETVVALAAVEARLDLLREQVRNIDDMSRRAVSQAMAEGVCLPALWAAADAVGPPVSAADTDYSEGVAVSEPRVSEPRVRGSMGAGSREAHDTMPSDLVEIVRSSGGQISPDDLWLSSAYSDDIEAFYAALRSSIGRGALRQRVVDWANRTIEVTS